MAASLDTGEGPHLGTPGFLNSRLEGQTPETGEEREHSKSLACVCLGGGGVDCGGGRGCCGGGGGGKGPPLG